MTTKEEQLLIETILEGNASAYSKLVDSYKNMVFTLALRMVKNREEAEEVAQDVFLKIYKSIKKFNGDSKFSTWIYKIAYNTCLDQIKKNKKFLNEVSIDNYYNKVETIDNALEKLIKQERYDLIRQSVRKLPEDSSALITLFYFEELSLDEISEIIEIEANTVKVKLHRARKRLLGILEKDMSSQNILNYGT